MTGFIVSVLLFRNRVSSKEAFEGLELGEGKLSRPVLRGPGGRKAAWLLGRERFRARTWAVSDNDSAARRNAVHRVEGDPLVGRVKAGCLQHPRPRCRPY